MEVEPRASGACQREVDDKGVPSAAELFVQEADSHGVERILLVTYFKVEMRFDCKAGNSDRADHGTNLDAVANVYEDCVKVSVYGLPGAAVVDNNTLPICAVDSCRGYSPKPCGDHLRPNLGRPIDPRMHARVSKNWMRVHTEASAKTYVLTKYRLAD